jgi:hypothetical protein
VAQVEEKTKTLQPNSCMTCSRVMGSGGVVLVVFERIGDGFADVGEGGEMDHGGEAVFFEQAADQGGILIAHIADDQFHAWDPPIADSGWPKTRLSSTTILRPPWLEASRRTVWEPMYPAPR